MSERAIETKAPGGSEEASGAAVPSAGVPPAPEPRVRWRRLLDAALPLSILLAMAAVEFPLCPTRLFVGVPCPGCGLTRATLAMLQLDLAAVWRFHPLAPVMAPVVGWFLGKPILEELGWIPKHKVFVKIPNAVWLVLLVLFFGLYVARLGGLLGGLPDPVDPAGSLVGRMIGAVLPHAH